VGSRKTQRPHNKSFKERKQVFKERVRPLSRLQQTKNFHEGGRQSFSRITLQNQNCWGGRGAGTPAPLCQGTEKFTLFLISFVLQYA